MRFLKFLMLLLGFIAFMMLQSCKENCPCDDPTNPTCDNYDPCFGKEAANATFHYYCDLSTSYGEYHFKTDTIEMEDGNASVRVFFKVDDPNVDSCWWSVGADPRVFREKEFSLTFKIGDAPLRTRLIVDKSSALDCNPNDPVRDTFYRELTLMPLGSSSIYGTYKGYFDGNTSDTGTIRILTKRFFNVQMVPILRNNQEPPGIDSGTFHFIIPGWNSTFAIRPLGAGINPFMAGICKVSNSELRIDYKYRGLGSTSDDPNRNRTFNGIKQ